MIFRAFFLLKLTQICVIVAILWQVFSLCTICGRFINTKEVLRLGIEGTCRRLFFYLPPQFDESSTEPLLRLPHLRLWWSYESQKFLPPKPPINELNQTADEIKQDIQRGTNLLKNNVAVEMRQKRGILWKKVDILLAILKAEDQLELEPTEFVTMQKMAIMPEEEEKPDELLELDENGREEVEKLLNLTLAYSNGKLKLVGDRQKRDDNYELPWITIKRGVVLPHEESKKRDSTHLDLQSMDNPESNFAERSITSKNVDENIVHCFELNLQEYTSYPHPDPSSGWTTSPLVILSNRSVATVAVGFAHLLLLFAQVYLLNCLDIDNLEQRRGKLFLELLIILLGCFCWLVVLLLKLRTELNWQMDWMCTNFKPEIFRMIIVLASALLLLGAFEAVHIFMKMRKCIKQIDLERENGEFKPQRPPIH